MQLKQKVCQATSRQVMLEQLTLELEILKNPSLVINCKKNAPIDSWGHKLFIFYLSDHLGIG